MLLAYVRFIVMLLFCINLPFFSFAQSYNIGVLDFRQPTTEEYRKMKRNMVDWQTGSVGGPQERQARDKQYIAQARAYVIEELLKDERFVLVERKNLNLIQKEKEYQKSEAFLDGYIVEQGKSIGADYLFSGMLLMKKKKMSLSIFSVKENLTVASTTITPKFNLISGSTLQTEIKKAVQILKDKVFPKPIQVIRALKEGKGVKKLLIAAGESFNLKEKQSLVIYYQKEEEYQGRKMLRDVTVGKGKIDEVEGDDFSVLTVKKGGVEIKKLLKDGTPLFCKK